MSDPLAVFLRWMTDRRLDGVPVIGWGAPVPSFGDASTARVATLGLNPSNLEFVDSCGDELNAAERRFHTLGSLCLADWGQAQAGHREQIWTHCRNYFMRNPYDAWFGQLEYLISRTGSSFYGPWASACHLDLIPFATSKKWTDLTAEQKRILLSISAESLALILAESSIETLILNGQGVVDHFQRISGVELSRTTMKSWNLPRKGGQDVSGFAYHGSISGIGQCRFVRPIRVFGYNHNIQSSFGVTKAVRSEIRDWLAKGMGTIETSRLTA